MSFGSRPVTRPAVVSRAETLRAGNRVEGDAALGIGRALLDELGGFLAVAPSMMELPYDLLILRPSRPGISGASDRMAAGSGNTGFFLA